MGVRFRYTSGSMNDLEAAVLTTSQKLADAAERIVKESVDEGMNLQIKTLVDAHTRTGLKRVAYQTDSGEPGRDKTGHMIEQIDNDVDISESAAGKTVRGRWGWLDGVEPYFVAQDDGTDIIPAADSLVGSFLTEREKFAARVYAELGK